MRFLFGRKISSIVAVAAVTIALVACALTYFGNSGTFGTQVEKIVVAAPPLEQNALLYVAEKQGFFAKNGLNVTITDYDSGLSALNGMLQGEAQIAEAAEFPFVSAVFQNKSVSILACNDKFENEKLVALRTHMIENISDLKGKIIGVARGTIAEFYLGRFLELNGLSVRDVNLVDVKPAQFVKAIADGSIDALVAWQPYVNQIQSQVSGAIFYWPVQSSQDAYGVLVTNKDWVNEHSDAVEKFLKSLKDAEDFVVYHQSESKLVVKEKLSYTDSFLASLWSQHSYSLSLDQPLVVAMKDEAAWLINNGLINATSVPNFVDYIYFDGLVSVKPESVTIIR